MGQDEDFYVVTWYLEARVGVASHGAPWGLVPSTPPLHDVVSGTSLLGPPLPGAWILDPVPGLGPCVSNSRVSKL